MCPGEHVPAVILVPSPFLPHFPTDQCTYRLSAEQTVVLPSNTRQTTRCSLGYFPTSKFELTCGPNAEMGTTPNCTLMHCLPPHNYAPGAILNKPDVTAVNSVTSSGNRIGDMATLSCKNQPGGVYLGVTVKPANFSAQIVCSHRFNHQREYNIWLPAAGSPYQFDDGSPATGNSRYPPAATRFPFCDGNLLENLMWIDYCCARDGITRIVLYTSENNVCVCVCVCVLYLEIFFFCRLRSGCRFMVKFRSFLLGQIIM